MNPVQASILQQALDPEVQERLRRDLGVARDRLERVTLQRPILTCAIALAAGYLAGRAVWR